MSELKIFIGALMVSGHDFPDIEKHRGTQRQAVVAARSQAKAAEAFHVPISFVRNYCSVTGNLEDISVASLEPGVVFYQGKFNEERNGEYRKVWYRRKEDGWERVQPSLYEATKTAAGREL